LGDWYLRTGKPLRVGVADAVLALDGGDELVDERVEFARVRPSLPLQVLQQLLVRRIKLHASRQPRQVLDRRRRLHLTDRASLLSICYNGAR
jgi:hypothetical protein